MASSTLTPLGANITSEVLQSTETCGDRVSLPTESIKGSHYSTYSDTDNKCNKSSPVPEDTWQCLEWARDRVHPGDKEWYQREKSELEGILKARREEEERKQRYDKE
jgi:hypothetical protein